MSKRTIEEMENDFIAYFAEFYNEENLKASLLTCCEAFGAVKVLNFFFPKRVWILEASKMVMKYSKQHIDEYHKRGIIK